MAMADLHAERRWWAASKKKEATPLPSAPSCRFLSSAPLPGERSSSALPLQHSLPPLHVDKEEDDLDSELTQKVALIMQKELQKLKSHDHHRASKLSLPPESLPTSTAHGLQEPHFHNVTSMSSILEMEQLSIIKALELENVQSLEKQGEHQEEVEMLKSVITAVSDEKEELQEEVEMLKVSATAMSLEKKELEEEVEMLKDMIRSMALEREQHLLKIRALEMVLEENVEECQKLVEEVERLSSEQYVVTVQVQEFSY